MVCFRVSSPAGPVQLVNLVRACIATWGTPSGGGGCLMCGWGPEIHIECLRLVVHVLFNILPQDPTCPLRGNRGCCCSCPEDKRHAATIEKKKKKTSGMEGNERRCCGDEATDIFIVYVCEGGARLSVAAFFPKPIGSRVPIEQPEICLRQTNIKPARLHVPTELRSSAGLCAAPLRHHRHHRHQAHVFPKLLQAR